MKLLFLLIALVPALALAQLSTNTYQATNLFTAPVKRTFVTPNVWTGSIANYKNDNMGQNPTNQQYVMETNWLTATATNNVVVQVGSSFGFSAAGYGSVNFTNPSWPSDKLVKFTTYWPTNMPPVPLNVLVPLKVVATHPKVP